MTDHVPALVHCHPDSSSSTAFLKQLYNEAASRLHGIVPFGKDRLQGDALFSHAENCSAAVFCVSVPLLNSADDTRALRIVLDRLGRPTPPSLLILTFEECGMVTEPLTQILRERTPPVLRRSKFPFDHHTPYAACQRYDLSRSRVVLERTLTVLLRALGQLPARTPVSPMGCIYVGYHTLNLEAVMSIIKTIREEYPEIGAQLWIDQDDLDDIQDWDSQVSEALYQCKSALLFCTENFLYAKTCQKEVKILARRRESKDPLGVFGVHLDDVTRPPVELCYAFKSVTPITLSGRDNSREIVERLQQGPEDLPSEDGSDILSESGMMAPVTAISAVKTAGQKQKRMELFLGREEQLAQLEAALLSPDTRCVSVVGRGGVGKTALVMRCLHDMRARSPQLRAIVYVGPRTTNTDLATIAFYLAQVMPESSRVADKLKEIAALPDMNVGDTARLMLRLIRDSEEEYALREQGVDREGDKYYVLYIDNLEDIQKESGDVKEEGLLALWSALLADPHPLLRIVSTTRVLPQLMSTTGAHALVPMDSGLTDEQGSELLRRLDPQNEIGLRGAEPEIRVALTRAVHGMPRALEVIAAMLASNPVLTVEDIQRRLSGLEGLPPGSDKAEKAIEWLLMDSFANLDSTARKILEALAVFNTPVPLKAVQYVLASDLEPRFIESVVRRMAQMHQLDIDRRTKRASLHPLDVSFAIAQLSSDLRKKLELASAQYYEKHEVANVDHIDAELEKLAPLFNELKHLVNAQQYNRVAELLVVPDDEHPGVCTTKNGWPMGYARIDIFSGSYRLWGPLLQVVSRLRDRSGVWLVTDENLRQLLKTKMGFIPTLQFITPHELATISHRAKANKMPEHMYASLCAFTAVLIELVYAENRPLVLELCEETIRIETTALRAMLAEGPPTVAMSMKFRMRAQNYVYAARHRFTALAYKGEYEDVRRYAGEFQNFLLEICPPELRHVCDGGFGPLEAMAMTGQWSQLLVAPEVVPLLASIEAGEAPNIAVRKALPTTTNNGPLRSDMFLMSLTRSLICDGTRIDLAVRILEFLRGSEGKRMETLPRVDTLMAYAYCVGQRQRQPAKARLVLDEVEKSLGKVAFLDLCYRGSVAMMNKLLTAIEREDRGEEAEALRQLSTVHRNYLDGHFPEPAVLIADANAVLLASA